MNIGVPKEIKTWENRVALTPTQVQILCAHNHVVFVEKNAGLGSGFSDELYSDAGANILNTASDVFENAELIVKVKEPMPQEFGFIKPHHVVFTYFHFASSDELIQAMLKSKAVCIAYETVKDASGKLPLLEPMSMVAGRLSIQEGVRYLTRISCGKGILPGGIPGTKAAKTVIFGGGTVGLEAAKVSHGMGMNTFLLDINETRINQLKEILPPEIQVLNSLHLLKSEMLKDADIIVGAVLIPGAKAPKILTREDLKLLEPKTVLVDVAIDQGGCFETSHATTHSDPIHIIDDIIHYGVANMPGAVPHTATEALTNATFPFVLKIANLGWQDACMKDAALNEGLNIADGKIIHPSLKE